MVREAVKYYSSQWYHYPYPHISSIEGPIEGMEYPDDDLRPDGAGPDRPAMGPGPRAGAPVGPHGGRQQRTAVSVDGRGLQYLHRPGQRRPLLPGHGVRRLDRGPPASPVRRPRHSRAGAAAHHPPGRGARISSGSATRSRRSCCRNCATRSWARNGSTTPSASTSGPGPSGTRRRPTSSGSCGMHPGWISTGSGGSGSSPLPGWTRRWTRWARPKAAGHGSTSPTGGRMVMPLEMRIEYADGTREVVRLAGRDVEPGAGVHLPR